MSRGTEPSGVSRPRDRDSGPASVCPFRQAAGFESLPLRSTASTGKASCLGARIGTQSRILTANCARAAHQKSGSRSARACSSSSASASMSCSMSSAPRAEDAVVGVPTTPLRVTAGIG